MSDGYRGSETDMNIRNIETVYSGWLNNSNGSICIYICVITHTYMRQVRCLSVCFAVTNISMDQ